MSANTQRIVAYNGYPVPDSNGRATNTLGLTIKDGGASANLIQTSILPEVQSTDRGLQILNTHFSGAIGVTGSVEANSYSPALDITLYNVVPNGSTSTAVTGGYVSTLALNLAPTSRLDPSGTFSFDIPVNINVGSTGAICQFDINTSIILPAGSTSMNNTYPLVSYFNCTGVVKYSYPFATISDLSVMQNIVSSPNSLTQMRITNVSVSASDKVKNLEGITPAKLKLTYTIGDVDAYWNALRTVVDEITTSTYSDTYKIIVDAKLLLIQL
jgi:hypothetical protein